MCPRARPECVPLPEPPLKPAEPVRHPGSRGSSARPSGRLGWREGPSGWALQPCLGFSPGRWARRSPLCPSWGEGGLETPAGRRQPGREEEGGRVRPGVRRGGRRRGRNAGGSGRERCQRCYKQRVLSNTICPEIKGSETETQQPIRRQRRRQWRPGSPVWNYCSDLEPDPVRWREGH